MEASRANHSRAVVRLSAKKKKIVSLRLHPNLSFSTAVSLDDLI